MCREVLKMKKKKKKKKKLKLGPNSELFRKFLMKKAARRKY